MLAALQQLKAAAAAGGGSSSSYSSRLVFLALAGEQWGYMGSRRLLYEAATGSNATAGLDVSLVEQVGWVFAGLLRVCWQVPPPPSVTRQPCDTVPNNMLLAGH